LLPSGSVGFSLLPGSSGRPTFNTTSSGPGSPDVFEHWGTEDLVWGNGFSGTSEVIGDVSDFSNPTPFDLDIQFWPASIFSMSLDNGATTSSSQSDEESLSVQLADSHAVGNLSPGTLGALDLDTTECDGELLTYLMIQSTPTGAHSGAEAVALSSSNVTGDLNNHSMQLLEDLSSAWDSPDLNSMDVLSTISPSNGLTSREFACDDLQTPWLSTSPLSHQVATDSPTSSSSRLSSTVQGATFACDFRGCGRVWPSKKKLRYVHLSQGHDARFLTFRSDWPYALAQKATCLLRCRLRSTGCPIQLEKRLGATRRVSALRNIEDVPLLRQRDQAEG
jgi:hypothetical protein